MVWRSNGIHGNGHTSFPKCRDLLKICHRIWGNTSCWVSTSLSVRVHSGLDTGDTHSLGIGSNSIRAALWCNAEALKVDGLPRIHLWLGHFSLDRLGKVWFWPSVSKAGCAKGSNLRAVDPCRQRLEMPRTPIAIGLQLETNGVTVSVTIETKCSNPVRPR